MRQIDCADMRELAAEFSLGLLDGATRAEVVHHIDHCPACRAAQACAFAIPMRIALPSSSPCARRAFAISIAFARTSGGRYFIAGGM